MTQGEPLKTYLAMYRKRTGLTQVEVAHILGKAVSSTGVSRNECGESLPILKTILKYEILYAASASDLFEGMSQDMRDEMVPNIRGLILALARKSATRGRTRKLAFLRRLLGEEEGPDAS